MVKRLLALILLSAFPLGFCPCASAETAPSAPDADGGQPPVRPHCAPGAGEGDDPSGTEGGCAPGACVHCATGIAPPAPRSSPIGVASHPPLAPLPGHPAAFVPAP